MIPRRRLLQLLPILLVGCSLVALAQHDDEQTLYFAPTIDVRMVLSRGSEEVDADRGQTELVPRVRETHEVMPFMPVIFFDPGSPSIPQRYQTFYSTRETDTYTDSSAIGAMDDIDETGRAKYLQILNVIGYRLSANPRAEVALEPGYSHEPGESAGVAAERGIVVRDYLANIWRIAPERITILPPRRFCDSSDNAFAQQEARRVIVQANDPEIIRPICFVQVEANAGLLTIAATITPNISPARIAGVELIASAGDRILTRYAFAASPDSTLYRVEGVIPTVWTYEGMPDQVSVQAVVTTNEGHTRATKVHSVPVRMNLRTRSATCTYEEDDYLRVPLFSYRDTTLSRLQLRWLDEFAGRVLARHGDAVRDMQVRISSAPDMTEVLGISDDQLAMFTNPLEIFQQEMIAPLLDPRREIPMFVRRYDEDDDGDEDGYGHGGNEMEVLRTWFGDDAVTRLQEFQKAEMERYGYGEEDGSGTGMPHDSAAYDHGLIRRARERAVQTYLESKLGTHPREDVETSYDASFSGGTVMTAPEDRFLARVVEVWVAFPADTVAEVVSDTAASYEVPESYEEHSEEEYHEEEYTEEGYEEGGHGEEEYYEEGAGEAMPAEESGEEYVVPPAPAPEPAPAPAPAQPEGSDRDWGVGYD